MSNSVSTNRIALQQIENKIFNKNQEIERPHFVDKNCVAQDFIDLVITNARNSDVSLMLTDTIIELQDCCKNIYSTRVMCNDVLSTAKSTRGCVSEWKVQRKYRITGSRCYNLFTYSKGDWPEKARKYFWAKEFTSKYTDHVNKYESVARALYAKEKDVFIQECGLVVCHSEPWLAYSPDGVVMKNGELCRLLEIKCPFELQDTKRDTLLKKCKAYLSVNGRELRLKEKHQYYAQIQLGMAILKLNLCDFVIYSNISDTCEILTVAFDKKYTSNLLITLKKNYFDKMLHQVCLYSRV